MLFKLIIYGFCTLKSTTVSVHCQREDTSLSACDCPLERAAPKGLGMSPVDVLGASPDMVRPVGAGPGWMGCTVSAKDKVVAQGSKMIHKNLWENDKKAAQKVKSLLLGEAMSESGTPDSWPKSQNKGFKLMG